MSYYYYLTSLLLMTCHITSLNSQKNIVSRKIIRSKHTDRATGFPTACDHINKDIKKSSCFCTDGNTLHVVKRYFECQNETTFLAGVVGTCVHKQYLLIEEVKEDVVVNTNCNNILFVQIWNTDGEKVIWSTFKKYEGLIAKRNETFSVNTRSKALHGLLIKVNLNCKTGSECVVIKIPGTREYPLDFTLIQSEKNTTIQPPMTDPTTTTEKTTTVQIAQTTTETTTQPGGESTTTEATKTKPSVTLIKYQTTAITTGKVIRTTKVTTAIDSKNSSSSSSTKDILIGVIAGLLALVVLLLFVFVITMRRKKKNSEQSTNIELQHQETPLYQEYEPTTNQNVHSDSDHEYETIAENVNNKADDKNTYDYAYGSPPSEEYSYAYNNKNSLIAPQKSKPGDIENEKDKTKGEETKVENLILNNTLSDSLISDNGTNYYSLPIKEDDKEEEKNISEYAILKKDKQS